MTQFRKKTQTKKKKAEYSGQKTLTSGFEIGEWRRKKKADQLGKKTITPRKRKKVKPIAWDPVTCLDRGAKCKRATQDNGESTPIIRMYKVLRRGGDSISQGTLLKKYQRHLRAAEKILEIVGGSGGNIANIGSLPGKSSST